VNQGKFKLSSKTFTFNAISVLKKVNLNVWHTNHHLFKISGGPVWFKSHHIFECYNFSGYRASSMSHHTAPTPPLQAALPPLCMAALPSPFERELLYG
jgi:hypothetical protein